MQQGGNPYESMAGVLQRLGFTAKGAQGYQSQFGISFAKRAAVGIDGGDHALMAGGAAIPQPVVDNLSTLVAQVQQIFKLGEGEYSMCLPDVPSHQIEPPAIYIAANPSAAQKGGEATVHKMGVCRVINGEAFVSPTSSATTYSRELSKLNIDFGFQPDGTSRIDTVVRIITKPEHGSLEQEYPDATDYRKYHYTYSPNEGFTGFDHFVMKVTVEGVSVEVHYTFSVNLPTEPTYKIDERGERVDDTDTCPRAYWKISFAVDSYGNSTLISVNTPSAIQSMSRVPTDLDLPPLRLPFSLLAGMANDLPGGTVTFADLPTGSANA